MLRIDSRKGLAIDILGHVVGKGALLVLRPVGRRSSVQVRNEGIDWRFTWTEAAIRGAVLKCGRLDESPLLLGWEAGSSGLHRAKVKLRRHLSFHI